jgi:hypothetical protein
MIDLSPESLAIVTDGYGLRETLFYKLFGELQVYETREDMWQAIHHLKNGAISLDGGIIKGDGMLILGYRSVVVLFLGKVAHSLSEWIWTNARGVLFLAPYYALYSVLII